LMERIYQMHVVPDVVPTIRPAVDIRVSFTESIIQKPSSPCIPVPQKKWATDLSDVVPGLFISPAKTVEPPKITAQAFHPEPRLYTLLMIDPDVPSTTTTSFQNYLHWLILIFLYLPRVTAYHRQSNHPLPSHTSRLIRRTGHLTIVMFYCSFPRKRG